MDCCRVQSSYPLVFVMYINNFDNIWIYTVSTFADDTTIGSIIDGKEGYIGLQ